MVAMKKDTGRTATVYPPTTMRLDPELVYRAKRLALENAREGRPEDGLSKVLNAALRDYLRKRGA